MSTNTDRLRTLSAASRGSRSVRTINAMTTAINSLIQRLKEIAGIRDQRRLMSMTPINNIRLAYVFMALGQWNCLLASTNSARQPSPLNTVRSSRLPAVGSPTTPNHVASGLLATSRIQIVGIHRARDSPVALFLSMFRRKATKRVHTSSADTLLTGTAYIQTCD